MSDLPSREQSAEPQTREMNLADVVAFVRRHLLLICGLPLAAGLVTGVTMLLAVPRSYEASATLVVVPPKVSSDLKPSTLTLRDYQKLLESDAAIAEAKRRLVGKGVLKPDDPLRLNRELESRIFVSRRADELSLAPMLQAVARGASPENVAAIANTWAAVFLERTKSLMAGSTSSTVQFIDEQYPKVRTELATLENERVTVNDGYQKRSDDATDQWDQRIGAFKNQASDLLAVYQAETRRRVEEFASGRNLDPRNVELAALRKAYSDPQDERAHVSADLQQRQLQADGARKQLAATARFLTLQKAITDEALWAAMAASQDDKPD
jgi:capsular polysaccharide biosynthesis protein